MYQAALHLELWASILDDLILATESDAGVMRVCWPEHRLICSSLDEGWGQGQGLPAANERFLAYLRSKQLLNKGFFPVVPFRADRSNVRDNDFGPQTQAERDLAGHVGAATELPDGKIVSMELFRRGPKARYELDALKKLNGLHASFYQALFFAYQLELEKARSRVDALVEVGLPAALLGRNGRLLFCNTLFEEIREEFFGMSTGKLSLVGSDAVRKSFCVALEKASRSSANLNLPAHHSRPPAILRILPVRREETSFFSLTGTILILSSVATTVNIPPFEIVSELFGLTSAEARLAVALTSGLSLRDSAANQGITVGTARSYLVRVFAKTGTARQSELVSLFKGVSSVWGRRQQG